MRTGAAVRRWVCRALLALATVLALLPSAGAASRRGSSAAAVEKQFDHRVEAYLTLHRRVDAKIGTLSKTADPAAITKRQRALGEAIREARAEARQGDIFTPDVATLIRRLIARDLARRGPVDRRAFIVSQPQVAVHVNDFYPATVPLGTVPPALLRTLPHLPQPLQYRFIGNSLILFDVDPNLVVDVLPDAVPARYRKR